MTVSNSDFACPCCGANAIKSELVTLVKAIETKLGASLTVNSGYRCKKHNTKVGGSANSQHLLGNAADITAHMSVRQDLFKICDDKYSSNEIGGLGKYSTFRHVDKGSHRTWSR